MVSSRSLFAVKLCVALLGLLNIYLALTLRRPKVAVTRQYSYINDDFPARLDVPGLYDKVVLLSEQTVHYGLNGTDADEEWEALLPPSVGRGVVHLGPHYRTFAVTMLHTLHCLDRLRHSIFDKPVGSGNIKHIEHCANYVRELILCSADTQLELEGEPHVARVCRDWTAVYAEMHRNLVEYETKGKPTTNVS